MSYVAFEHPFWDAVAISFTEQFGIHRENVATSQSTIGENCDHLDGETLYMLARTVGLGVDEEHECWVGQGAWTPEYTANRLHRRLGLR